MKSYIYELLGMLVLGVLFALLITQALQLTDIQLSPLPVPAF